MTIKKRLIIFIALAVFLLPLVYSSYGYSGNIGTFKQDECIQLRQTCPTCTYLNFTGVIYPDSLIAMGEVSADKTGTVFNYTFCSTEQKGRYIVEGYGNVGGSTDTPFVYSFDITTNGNPSPSGIVIVIYTMLFIFIFGSFLIYFFKALGETISLELDLLSTVTLISIYFSVWIFHYFSMEFLGDAVVNDFLNILISVGAFTHLFLPLVAFAVTMIMTNLKFNKKSRVTY